MNREVLFFVGVIAIVAATYVSRMYLEKGIRSLDNEKRAALIDAFSRQRFINLVPILVVLAVEFAGIKMFPQNGREVAVGCLLLLLVVLVVIALKVRQKLIAVGLPDESLRLMMISRGVSLLGSTIGVILFGASLFATA